jgi:uncharacterized membrane protein
VIASFLIGFFAGLRSLVAPAATAWAAHLGRLTLERPLSLIGSLPSVIVFSILAVGELIVDKLPRTPNRTALLGVIARILTGALTGACVAAGRQEPALMGALLGAAGGVTGCYLGYYARTRTVKALGVKDFYVAVLEDVIALVGSFWLVLRS